MIIQIFKTSKRDDYQVSLKEMFQEGLKIYKEIAINKDVMGGTPCIRGTRIPVFMILDALHYFGNVDTVRINYGLKAQQVQDAIGFAKLVLECQIEP